MHLFNRPALFISLAIILMLACGMFAISAFGFVAQDRQMDTVSVSQLAQDLSSGRVSSMTVGPSTVVTTYADGHTARTPFSRQVNMSFVELMRSYGVTFDELARANIVYVSPPLWDNWLALGGTILPCLLIGGLASVIFIAGLSLVFSKK